MAINEWYEDALRRKTSAQTAIAVIEEARIIFNLKCDIDAALEARDEEKFYALTKQLRGME